MELLIVVVIVALVAGWGVVVYNRLVKLRNLVKNAWSQIEVQLMRRADLIPNLVETVKGYASHERETFEAVIEARAGAVGASGPREAAAAEGPLTMALGKLFAVAEAYPDLKANENFQSLQDELTDTENRVSFSRQAYNDITTKYNTAIQVFPALIIAGIGRFSEEELFDAPEEAEKVPEVRFQSGYFSDS